MGNLMQQIMDEQKTKKAANMMNTPPEITGTGKGSVCSCQPVTAQQQNRINAKASGPTNLIQEILAKQKRT